MTARPDDPWTHLKDSEGRPICCRCRVHDEARFQIRWQMLPPGGNVICYTCFACWGAMTDDQRSLHRKMWRPIE